MGKPWMGKKDFMVIQQREREDGARTMGDSQNIRL